jgi:hypothetical protein
MPSETASRVIFKFRRPSGAPSCHPSQAMTQALRQFAQTDEMQGLLAQAKAQRRTVVLEVFHAKDGHPLLIYPVLRETTA